MAPLAGNDGGYWPTAWGWAALGLAWVAVMALALHARQALGRLEVVFLAATAAFLAWIAASVAWSLEPERSVLEAQRAAVFATGVLAAVVLVRSRCYRQLLGGVLAAISVVSLYALATRLYPERLGVVNDVAGYRLSAPLGYWNALGIFAAMGILLALGFATRGRSPWTAACSAASLVVLLPTLYFTFSRGALAATAVGLAAAVVFDRRRLQFVTTGLAVSLLPAAAVAVSYRSHALSRPTASLAAAASDGRRVGLIVAALALANAGIAVGAWRAGRRFQPRRALRIVWSIVLVAVVASAVAAGLARYGNPVAAGRHAYDSFVSPPPLAQTNLNSRLFSLSSNGRVDLWHTAWLDARERPLHGSGAGTYELFWNASPRNTFKARDAHSLYLETFAELGAVGLTLLLIVLLVPVAAALRARHRGLAPAALGAYVAFLVHAGIDWDWEMTAVTLTAAFCGVALLAAARTAPRRSMSIRARVALVTAACVVGALAFLGLVGNGKLAAATSAADSGRWQQSAARAREARTWMPWSSEPWRVEGEAQLARRRFAAARVDFRRGLDRDSRSWELWLDLALATDGPGRRVAAHRAFLLNPHNTEVRALATRLGVAR